MSSENAGVTLGYFPWPIDPLSISYAGGIPGVEPRSQSLRDLPRPVKPLNQVYRTSLVILKHYRGGKSCSNSDSIRWAKN